VKHNSANYDLNEFTHSNTITQTSTPLLKTVSEFVVDASRIFHQGHV